MLDLWTRFTDLVWWQMTLWVAYTIYFIVRSVHIYLSTDEHGIRKGYKYIFFGRNPKHFRLYHLIRMLFDIPPLVVGLLFPVVKAIFRFKLYTFKEPEVTVKGNHMEVKIDDVLFKKVDDETIAVWTGDGERITMHMNADCTTKEKFLGACQRFVQ